MLIEVTPIDAGETAQMGYIASSKKTAERDDFLRQPWDAIPAATMMSMIGKSQLWPLISFSGCSRAGRATGS